MPVLEPYLLDWATGAFAWALAIAIGGGVAVWWLRRRRSQATGADPMAAAAADSRPSGAHERQHFRGLFDALPFPVWLRSPDLAMISANRAYATAVGAPDAVGAVIRGMELGQGSLGEGGRSLAALARRTGVEQTQSATVIAGGARRLYQFSERPLADGWIVGSAQDVSAIDRLQTELTSHIEAHQEVLEQLQAGIAVFDSDRRLRFVNRAYADLWGLDHAWLAGAPLLSEVLETLRQKRRLPEVTDYAEFRRRMERRFQTVLQPEEQLLHLPDDRTLREVVAPHPLGGLLFVLEDVTDRLALESSYNTLIAVQRGILDQLADGIAAFGTDGRLSVFNPAFLRLLGFVEAHFNAGVHIADLLDRLAPQVAEDTAWPAFREAVAIAVTNREPLAHRLFLADGRTLDIACRPLSDGRELMRVRDISDTYNVERVLMDRNAALEEANRLKTDFLANASYELRTPLTTISGFAELLQSEIGGPLTPEQGEYLAGITKASDALAALIDSVLDVSLGEAGRWDAGAAEIALAPLIHSVAAVVRPQIEAQGLALNLHTAPNLPTIQADERRLRQLVFNLMTSAARHNRSAQQIEVTCLTAGDGVEIAAGIELPPLSPDRHLFEHELALTLVQRLAVLHGGQLTIDREANRARLVCRLPRRRGPIEGRQPAARMAEAPAAQ